MRGAGGDTPPGFSVGIPPQGFNPPTSMYLTIPVICFFKVPLVRTRLSGLTHPCTYVLKPFSVQIPAMRPFRYQSTAYTLNFG